LPYQKVYEEINILGRQERITKRKPSRSSARTGVYGQGQRLGGKWAISGFQWSSVLSSEAEGRTGRRAKWASEQDFGVTGQARLREGGVEGGGGRTTLTEGDGMLVKGGVSLDFFRQLAQFLSNSCRCPDGVRRSSLPLPAASSCLLRRRQRLGPRHSCGRERRRARSGRCRQCGTTSARRNRR